MTEPRNPVDELIAIVEERKRLLPPAAERRRIREDAGVSLRDVGAALGVSHSLIRYWENDTYEARSIEQLREYARLLAELKRIVDEDKNADA